MTIEITREMMDEVLALNVSSYGAARTVRSFFQPEDWNESFEARLALRVILQWAFEKAEEDFRERSDWREEYD